MSDLRMILIAEDNPHDAELTLAAISSHRVANEVVLVRDGSEVMDFLHARGAWASRRPGLPSVILLDLKMPKVDGLEVLRQVRNDPRLATIPVVMLTSSAEDRDIAESYRLGANAYVVKPVAFEEFMHAVGHLGQFWALLNEPPPAEAA